MHLVGNGYFDFYTRFNVDGCDLLNDLRGRMQIDDTFVNSHLKKIRDENKAINKIHVRQ